MLFNQYTIRVVSYVQDVQSSLRTHSVWHRSNDGVLDSKVLPQVIKQLSTYTSEQEPPKGLNLC